MSKSGAKTLLMGGQACVLYGGAEFSRDSDFAIFASPENLTSLQEALNALQARNIAVPPFEIDYLQRGHAIHFRCFHPDCYEMRVDVMSKMRGVDEFETLWERRTTFEMPDGEIYEALNIADLVQAKKTQRDKDWPMISRLVQAHYFSFKNDSTPERLAFWFRELRTPNLLLDLAREFNNYAADRVAAYLALENASEEVIQDALWQEEQIERELDRQYWQPLRKELEELRRKKRTKDL